MELAEISRKAVELLLERKITVSLAESCTGGMIASALVDWPGVSEALLDGLADGLTLDELLEGCVCYTNEAKMRTLGVSAETLGKHTAVSAQCAGEMARGMRAYTGSDYALSVTGIAGPGGGTVEMPVGLVYLGIADKTGERVERHVFSGDRTQVRRQAAARALEMLIEEIE